MRHLRNQRGAVLLALTAFLILGIAAALTTVLARNASGAHRDRTSERALAAAREALIAYATSRPLDEVVGPGYLPCPDLDDDGWAESTCGSLAGDIGQEQRLGRLPWKTLGLPDLRDGSGERLWYAVSTKYKGLLNCAASTACLDMSPDAALGTITVRDSSGALLHDGRIADPARASAGGAVAVIFAPGPPIDRYEGEGNPPTPQVRGCAGGTCNAAKVCTSDPPMRTPKCNPVNYLDRSAGEDNARFVDRSNAASRALNGDGFIHGPVPGPDGSVRVNDRLAVIGWSDVVPAVMRRVAQEVSLCLRQYAADARNAGQFPWAAPACLPRDPALTWSDEAGARLGRIADTPFSATARDGAMSALWPGSACGIANADGTTAGLAAKHWWTAWKGHVFVSIEDANRAEVFARPETRLAPAQCEGDPSNVAFGPQDVVVAVR